MYTWILNSSNGMRNAKLWPGHHNRMTFMEYAANAKQTSPEEDRF